MPSVLGGSARISSRRTEGKALISSGLVRQASGDVHARTCTASTKPPLHKLSSQRTPRWREMDSNFPYAGAASLVVAPFCVADFAAARHDHQRGQRASRSRTGWSDRHHHGGDLHIIIPQASRRPNLEPTVRIHFPPAASLRTIGSATVFLLWVSDSLALYARVAVKAFGVKHLRLLRSGDAMHQQHDIPFPSLLEQLRK